MDAKEEKLKFIVDSMHGDLAKWLRILGYDTLYSRSYTDRQLLELALLGDRILVTKDRKLYAKARKLGVKAVVIESTITVEKLAELADRLDLELKVDPESSRCPECNGVLEKQSREMVRDKVPPGVREIYSVFYVCVKCGRVYWEGSHWRNIRSLVEEAKRLKRSLRKVLRIRLDKREGGEGIEGISGASEND